MRLLFSLLLLLASISSANAATMLGFPDKVVSGDTFSLCEGRACKLVTLCGISAPKQGAADFEKSRVALTAVLGGNLVKCTQVGGGTPCDGHESSTIADRVVASCLINGHDIAEPLLAGGDACEMTKASEGHYAKAGKGKACAN